MFFQFRSWLRRMAALLAGNRFGLTGTIVRNKDRSRSYSLRPCFELLTDGCASRPLSAPRSFSLTPCFERLEARVAPASGMMTFAPGAYIVDMGQTTQTVGNALKPYGLVYDMVTNFKVPVDWAINPAKTTYAFNNAAASVDFAATIVTGPNTTGTKSYSGGSFIIDPAFLTPGAACCGRNRSPA